MKIVLQIILICCLISCNKSNQHDFLFTEVSDSDITFSNDLENTDDLNILNYLYFYNGAGVTIADFNNDGLGDIYFTGNVVSDKLYLNQGQLAFKDITTLAGINNNQPFTTGVTSVDINQDGLLDIYVCKVSKHSKSLAHNLLYINQGVNEAGIPQFREESKNYGLQFSGYSTQSVFFDYDLDGDLDLFLLNHSLYPNSNYGNGNKRLNFDALAGDRLFRNDDNFFKDISKEAGLYQSKIGYGLGVSVGDLNSDGYPDIYIGNDFFENDYLYINQKNGTFKEINEFDKALGHTSHFSMGNSVADLNNDLQLDIVSVDMLPQDLKTLKSAAVEYNYPIYQRYVKNGYNHQFMQNTLHLNSGNETFSEVGFLSGIAATEWSWSPLAADFDNDGLRDLFITNGIKGVTNDMDFISFISNDNIQRDLSLNNAKHYKGLISKLPQKKVSNVVFKNLDGIHFEDVSKYWLGNKPSFSNGAAYADLDNDGDLDIVINNVDEHAVIYRNNSNIITKNNYLKVSFKGVQNNRNGIGAKVITYIKGHTLIAENYTTNGYMSSKEPQLHFGLGKVQNIDSIHIIWPSKKWESIINPKINETLKVNHLNAKGNYYETITRKKEPYFDTLSPIVSYMHDDQETFDFSRNPLLPYSLSNNTPDVAVGDINNDGLDDIIITGAKKQPLKVYIQGKDEEFKVLQSPILDQDAICDDTYIEIVDLNGDNKNELVVVSGGNEFKTGKPLQPRLYYVEDNTIVKDTTQFKDIFINASKVSAVDWDNDGDKDLSITSNVAPHKFGINPKHYLLENNGKAQFEDITNEFSPDINTIGNVYDVVWKDLDKNGYPDAILAGHWMPITILMNDGKMLKKSANIGLNSTNGFWNTVVVEDFDNDGDMDIMAGNFGLNTRLRATKNNPITLYNYDFDTNSSIESVVTYFYNGVETTIATKDELVKQLPKLNKNYLSYNAFSKASVSELFGEDNLKKANKKQVTTLESYYFENLGGTYKSHKLPPIVQNSSVHSIAIDDINSDGYMDVILGGNNFELSTQLGRLDASHGMVLMNDKKGFFNITNRPLFDIFGQIRDIEFLNVNNEKLYLFGRNKDSLVVLKKSKEKNAF